MNKSIFCIAATFLLFSFAPIQISATTNPVPLFVSITTGLEPTKSDILLSRLNEIKAMDKSTLSSVEKKALRTETKSINKELRATNSGVYLSTGAIILIAVLLIILL
ncbi:MAG: hypothetical protein IPH31_25925 [Lewinellaceae bacterium]|nr:hypothetical protein [Lewinellaceae bacterium]